MNRAIIKRWINEYLDGEIGLADKAELERVMAENESVRREYRELRQIGLLLGSIPEIKPHPYRFRERMRGAISSSERLYLTPQRAFALAMLVFLLVIGLSFTLYMYQQRMLGGQEVALGAHPSQEAAQNQGIYTFVVATGVSADSYFNRVLLEYSMGIDHEGLLKVFLAQSPVYEGAVCRGRTGLKPALLREPLPASMIVNVSPEQAMAIARVAEELSGQPVKCRVFMQGSFIGGLKGFAVGNPELTVIPLQLSFTPPLH